MDDLTPFIDLKKQSAALSPDLEKAILAVVEGTQFINGPEVTRLEEALAEYVGVTHVVTCANGTDALTLPLLAYDLKQNDAVFCPSFTFIATAEVVALRGATPVFVDVDLKTYNISIDDLVIKFDKIKKEGRYRPRAIIPVDLFGLPANLPFINQFAKDNDLLVIEDAAQGFGGRLNNQKAGSLAPIGATSFFPAKPLGAYGDGGAIFTNDADLAKTFRSLKNHGSGVRRYEHERIGINSRLDSLQAAVLLVKLAAFPSELEARQEVAANYTKRLRDMVQTPFIPPDYYSSWAQYTIRVPAQSRDQLRRFLSDHGVPTNVYYPLGLHQQEAFTTAKERPLKLAACPVTEAISGEVLSLPMHPYLNEATIDRICSLVIEGLGPGNHHV
ncbi:MAG: DegT/DnrJ/EryC1/StrS family aminotransferase [Deltaproteobacteria bacterium]|jgi:dTDP-4-amino-4,6-dideoxygalactose transaminase|nr:DegT/DnrJ/EryC1/StrS family aminotransferase [Deltaproteobacteria bacterium]